MDGGGRRSHSAKWPQCTACFSAINGCVVLTARQKCKNGSVRHATEWNEILTLRFQSEDYGSPNTAK